MQMWGDQRSQEQMWLWREAALSLTPGVPWLNRALEAIAGHRAPVRDGQLPGAQLGERWPMSLVPWISEANHGRQMPQGVMNRTCGTGLASDMLQRVLRG